jgi:Protein of unknown function (DUF4058)
MPSPFPGMDPYLEHPARWPDVHHRLITASSDYLTEQLRPRYFVRIEERVYVSDPEDPGRDVIIPDLRIGKAPNQDVPRPAGQSQAVATIEPITRVTLIEDEIHEARLEVIDAVSRGLVTVIEFLSPTNKVTGSRGRESYREKQLEVMHSPTHLVEIDLLRGGARTVEQLKMPPFDYLVHVSRAYERPRGKLWPIPLRSPLPPIPIPLKRGDADAVLDLQRVLNTVYDRAAYELTVDYSAEPVPPLNEEQARWAKDLLRTRAG